MKFERPNSNIVPFGTNANKNKRFAFGTNNYTNDINENLNDSFKLGWETVGINSKPPRQWFNGLAYTSTYLTSYLFQTGIPEWNENQEYYINSITKGSDGKLYRSLVGTESSPNVNKNPLTEPNYWKNDNFELYEDSKFSIGFMDHLTSSLTKTSNSITLTFNADTKIYKYGKPYLFEAGESIAFSTSSLSIGIGYYIILDLDTRTLFARSGTPNFSEDILVSWILLNSSSNIIWANDERHLCSRNVEWHKNHHLEVGASWLRGGNLIFTKDTVGAVNIEVNTPVLIADEELFYTIENNNTPTLPFQQKLQGSTNYNVYFLDNNQNYDFTNSGNGSCPFLYSGTSIKYNDAINGGLVNASNENFVCYWQLYTTDWENPVKMIIGRVSHSNISDAEKEVFEDYGLNMPEIIGVAKIIIQSDSSIIGNPPLRIRGVYYLRNETVQSSALTPTNHNNLAGRNEADQHPISSITNLQASLDNKADKTTSIQITGTATFNGTTQTIDMTGIGNITLGIGDVIQINSPLNNRLHTVESIPSANQIIVNYEHRGTSTPVPKGRLIAETATATITLYNRAKNAPNGQGQYWCVPASGRSVGTYYPNTTKREMLVSIQAEGLAGCGTYIELESLPTKIFANAMPNNSTTTARTNITISVSPGDSYRESAILGSTTFWAERR